MNNIPDIMIKNALRHDAVFLLFLFFSKNIFLIVESAISFQNENQRNEMIKIEKVITKDHHSSS
jgi:hypothetical protein